jgi:hypothetical protein
VRELAGQVQQMTAAMMQHASAHAHNSDRLVRAVLAQLMAGHLIYQAYRQLLGVQPLAEEALAVHLEMDLAEAVRLSVLLVRFKLVVVAAAQVNLEARDKKVLVDMAVMALHQLLQTYLLIMVAAVAAVVSLVVYLVV